MTKGAPLAYSDTERWSFIHTFTELTLHTRSPSTDHVPRKSSSRPWPSDLLGIAGRRLADPLPALAHADARLPPADRRRADTLSPSSPAAPRRRPQDRLDEEQNRWERGVANPAMRHRCRCSRSPWADLRRIHRTPHLSHDTGVQDASATCWPACRAPCARAVSCEAKNGASGARSSSTARAARRGRPCPTSSGRSCHSSCGGRASWYPTVARRPTTHRTRRPWAAARGRGAGSAAGSRRAAPASLVRYCAIAQCRTTRTAASDPTPPDPPGGVTRCCNPLYRHVHAACRDSGRDWDTRSRRPDPGGARPARRVDGRALVSGRSTRREGRRHPRSVLCCRTGRHGVEGSGSMFIDRMPAGAHVRCLGRTSAQSTIIPSRRAGSDVEPAPPEEI